MPHFLSKKIWLLLGLAMVTLLAILVFNLFFASRSLPETKKTSFPPSKQPVDLYLSKDECEQNNQEFGCIRSRCVDGDNGSSNGCVGNWDGWIPIMGYVAL